MKISLEEIPNIPLIAPGDELGQIICNAISESDVSINDGDILCVASKIVSISENRLVDYSNIQPSELALKIHKKIPRKDERVIQLIINQSGDQSGDKLDVEDNYIGCWLPNGLKLTSAGIDKVDTTHVMLLPEYPDLSAKRISKTIYENYQVRVGVIITDSDGREDKIGATQIAIGLYGIPGLRESSSVDAFTGKTKKAQETICDMLAAASALIMGQRGNNKPVVIIKGLSYESNENSSIADTLCQSPMNNN